MTVTVTRVAVCVTLLAVVSVVSVAAAVGTVARPSGPDAALLAASGGTGAWDHAAPAAAVPDPPAPSPATQAARDGAGEETAPRPHRTSAYTRGRVVTLVVSLALLGTGAALLVANRDRQR